MKPLILIIVAFVFFSCNSPTESPTKSIVGAYNYSAYDSNNQLVVTGDLIITKADSTQVQGSWQLTIVNNAQKTGPQNGSGRLSGAFNKGTISINLNPEFADNNVLLRGSMNSFGLNGEWEWIGFGGKINGGSFNAIRKGI